jgi:hypothetical protein
MVNFELEVGSEGSAPVRPNISRSMGELIAKPFSLSGIPLEATTVSAFPSVLRGA